MFSAIALGQFFNKRNAVEHSLIFSMFIILLWKPLFLFDVGFQLSYTAVFGIIWIQPVLYQLWKPNFFIVDKGWQLITVSVAAQLGVLPISLFYFHQFPALFFISNLIIIPFLGVILGLGLVVLVLSYESILPLFLEGFYGDVISILNKVVAFVARQESFLFSEISFSALKMIFSYLLIISGFQLFLKLNTKRCFLFFGSILAFQCVLILEKYTIAQKSEFIVFHKSKNSIIGIRKGSSFELYHSMDSLQISSQKLLINYKVGENISIQNSHKLSNLMYYDKQVVLIIDKDGLYDIKELNNPIVLLRQSPKINLQRLVKKLKPAIIIADGSNYKSYIENWKTTCKNLKTPFWTTYNQGAYVLN
jgi:competence protein ComEC